MKKSLFTLGLSTLGLTFVMQANALNVVDLSSQNPADMGLDNLSFKSVFNTSSSERKLNYKSEKFDVKMLSSKADESGKIHTRYNQTYNGIPVYGRQVIHHKESSRLGFGVSKSKYTGQLVTDLDMDLAGSKVAAGFTDKSALEYAKSLHNSKNNSLVPSKLHYENESSELMVYTHDSSDKAKLVYRVSFFVDDVDGNNPARPTFIIDASTKEVIKSWNSLMHDRVATGPGGNEKIGKIYYGDDAPKLDVRETKRGECFMTSKKVRTVNLKNGYMGAKTHHFECYESVDEEVNGAYAPINDAHYYGEQVFNMYKDWYNKAPLTFKLIMRVHYGNNYENAFWNGSSMTFGDGRNYFYPLVSMDVVGHEVSHGYTEQNSNLEYMGQSGGINESFSDMAGKASEYYTFGANTWGIGEDITKGDEPLRYMDTPEKDGTSIGDARDYYEWLDVHYSSGVFNKAFYLLSTSDGWNVKKAFDVFVHANTFYWVPTTDYVEGALGSMYSAEDLGFDMQDVVDVFKKVGIECSDDSCVVMPKDEPKDEDSESDDGSQDDTGSDGQSDDGEQSDDGQSEDAPSDTESNT